MNNDAKVVSLLQHVTAIQHRRSRDILGKDSGFMLHFTCDLCGRPLRKERFVARIEIYPAYDPDELSVEDLDSDNLAEVAAQLQAEHAEAGSMYDDEAQEHRFDLCPSCHDRYRQDPLGRDALRRTNFSQN